MWVGFIMNWLCVAVTSLNANTWAYWLFDYGTYPLWAGNGTSDCLGNGNASTMSAL